MNNNMQIIDDLELLVRMCHSKSDGASLQFEEEEINNKINEINQEIDEIRLCAEEDNYDTSAEMADRNIEIMTKKVITSIKAELKVKNTELESLKEKESEVSEKISSIKENVSIYEEHISSMEKRIAVTDNQEVISRYNKLIMENRQRISNLTNELEAIETSYKRLQNIISKSAEEIENLEEKLKKKKEQLAETQSNLENKDNYVDQVKLDRNNKKVKDLETKKESLAKRLTEIKEDPKYLEAQIKKVLNNGEDKSLALEYLNALAQIANKIPYMNVAADNALEEELLRTTQARDTFANEIDQKSYNILDKLSPEQIRIDYLNQKIVNSQAELQRLEERIIRIDRDEEYNYQEKEANLSLLIDQAQNDLNELKKAYESESDTNLSAKALVKVSYDEKKEDLKAANKILSEFRKEEAEDIKAASELSKKEISRVKNIIASAEKEIEEIKNRLKSKKSGIIDIGAQNKDKEHLKELAKVVMDIKHRRQFAETPNEVVRRIEQNISSSPSMINQNLNAMDNQTNLGVENTMSYNQQPVGNVEPISTNNLNAISVEPPQNQEITENTNMGLDNMPKNDNLSSGSNIASEIDDYLNSLESSLG